jgi:hypothetical protein
MYLKTLSFAVLFIILPDILIFVKNFSEINSHINYEPNKKNYLLCYDNLEIISSTKALKLDWLFVLR